MARYKSRSKRLGEAENWFESAKTKVQEVADSMDLNKDTKRAMDELQHSELDEQRDAIESMIDDVRSSVEELKDEIESWKENMESNNMEHLPKFDEVSEAFDALEELVESLDSLTIPELPAVGDDDLQDSVEEWQEFGNEMDNVDFGNVSFPGMY